MGSPISPEVATVPVLCREGSYIRTVRLSRTLVGDKSCQWDFWFEAQLDGKAPRNFSTPVADLLHCE